MWHYYPSKAQPSGPKVALLVEVCCYSASLRSCFSQTFPTKRARMALLVGMCIFVGSQPNGPRWHCWSGCCFLASSFSQPSGRSGTVGQASSRKVSPTTRANWHCWSRLAFSLTVFPANRAMVALLVGMCSFLVSQPNGPRWHCWSGFFFKDEPNQSGLLALLVEACFFFWL